MIDIKEGWEVKKLGDLCQIELGKTPYRGNKSYWDSDKETSNVWLSIADLLNAKGDVVSDSKEFVSNDAAKILKIVKMGTLLLSFKLTLGRMAFAGKDLFTNEAIAALSVKNEKEIDKYFLHLFLSLFDWNAATEGDVKVKGKTLNKAKLKEIEIHFPKSLSEQQRIVSILDEAFAAIAKAKANAEQNLKNAKELFESYLQGVFEEKGEGWQRFKIENLCESITDCVNKTAPVTIEETPYKMIRTTNVRFGVVDLSTVRYVSQQVYLNWTRRQKPQFGDILFTREAPMGEVGMLLTDDNVFLGQRIVSYRVNENKILGNFLLYAFQSNNLKNQIKKLASGATVQHLRVPHTKSFEFDVPTISEQHSVIRKLDALSIETKKLESIYQKKIADLEELKKSLLEKAFKGELRIQVPTEEVAERPAKFAPISAKELQAGIVAFALQRHLEQNKVNTFKHVKAEKIVHLVERVLDINLDRNPIKDAAGPNDFPHAKRVEFRAQKAGYFYVKKGDNGYEYTAGSHIQSVIKKTELALHAKFDKLIWLVDLLIPMNTQQAEVVATVYAAWNNLLIDKTIVDDEAIVSEARENWHTDKLKIDRSKFFNAITWMKSNSLIPSGTGKRVLAKPAK